MDILNIKWENSGLPSDDQSSIIVPDTTWPLTDGQMTALRDAVNPRAASRSFGCDTYIAAVQFCEQFLGLWKNWSEWLKFWVERDNKSYVVLMLLLWQEKQSKVQHSNIKVNCTLSILVNTCINGLCNVTQGTLQKGFTAGWMISMQILFTRNMLNCKT